MHRIQIDVAYGAENIKGYATIDPETQGGYPNLDKESWVRFFMAFLSAIGYLILIFQFS